MVVYRKELGCFSTFHFWKEYFPFNFIVRKARITNSFGGMLSKDRNWWGEIQGMSRGVVLSPRTML
jgi:hypothetical protein